MANIPPAPMPPADSQGYAKAIVTGMAGAVVTLLVTVYDQYAPHPLPAEAIGALQTLVMGAATLFTPHNLFSK